MTTSRSSFRLALLLACGGPFLAFLDVTITNLAIPDLAGDFGGHGVAELSWVVTLYTIVFAAGLAPAGRLADVLGRRRLYVAGIAVFTLASLAAAVAPTFGVLLAARAVQGLGAAALLPASLAILLADLPAARRPAAIGLWSAAASVAAGLGPAIGGVLVDAFDWRALFCLNLPFGAWLVLRARALPVTAEPRGRVPDAIGSALLAGGIGLVVLAVTQGEAWGWGSVATVAALAGGVAAVGVALRRSERHPAPAVDTALWRIRTYAAANVVSALFGAALYAWLLVGVLFLTQVWHYSELKAGLAMTPGAVAAALVGIAVGRAARRPSPRALATGGGVVLGLTGGAIALWLPADPHFLGLWLPAGLIGGAGMGAVSVGVASAAALSAGPQRFAGATGLNVAARQVGGALGVAVMAVLLEAAGPATLAGFQRVYVVCGLSAMAAGLVGLRLVLPRAATSPTTAFAPPAAATAPAAPAPLEA